MTRREKLEGSVTVFLAAGVGYDYGIFPAVAIMITVPLWYYIGRAVGRRG